MKCIWICNVYIYIYNIFKPFWPGLLFQAQVTSHPWRHLIAFGPWNLLRLQGSSLQAGYEWHEVAWDQVGSVGICVPRIYTSVRLHLVLLRLYPHSVSLLCIEVKAFHGWTMVRAACRSLAVLALAVKTVGNGPLHPSQSGAVQGCAGMGPTVEVLFGWVWGLLERVHNVNKIKHMIL